jgi:1-acyl-sn-glycerol-3-phosphate acyltransferase
MIIQAKHNFLIHSFFRKYAVWIIRRHFRDVTIRGEFHDLKLPVLLIANHISWWDGFWAMYLNVKVLKRKFHFMMLGDQLRRFWFFRYTGGFSVEKNSRSVTESLQYAADLLKSGENMLLLFPQGKIETMHKQFFRFEKGIDRILKGKEEQVEIVFMVNLVDYFSAPKPTVDMYIQSFLYTSREPGDLQKEYNDFYLECTEMQQSIHRQ